MSLNNTQCYKLLGLSDGASIEEIKTAYRKLALAYHPDKNVSAKDGAKFKTITEAYNTLRMNNTDQPITNCVTQYQTKNKNHEYKVNNFPNFWNSIYLMISHNCTRYTKYFNYYYLKYRERLIKFVNKLESNTSFQILYSMEFFWHNRANFI